MCTRVHGGTTRRLPRTITQSQLTAKALYVGIHGRWLKQSHFWNHRLTFGGTFTPAQLVTLFDLNLIPHLHILRPIEALAPQAAQVFLGIGIAASTTASAPARVTIGGIEGGFKDSRF